MFFPQMKLLCVQGGFTEKRLSRPNLFKAVVYSAKTGCVINKDLIAVAQYYSATAVKLETEAKTQVMEITWIRARLTQT